MRRLLSDRADSIVDLEFTLAPARETCWTDITSGPGHSPDWVRAHHRLLPAPDQPKHTGTGSSPALAHTTNRYHALPGLHAARFEAWAFPAYKPDIPATMVGGA